MPRCVRNFWIETKVDGRKTQSSGQGPRGAGDGFTTTIYQRDQGDVCHVVEIVGNVTTDGRLILYVAPVSSVVTVEPYGGMGFKITTPR